MVRTPAGFHDFHNDDTFHHAYDVHRDIGGANPNCVFAGLLNNPTPGTPRPATAGGTPNDAPVWPVSLVENNPVTSYLTMDINSGQPLVVNMTGGNSAFRDGYVAREVVDGVAHTYGEGNNMLQRDTWDPLGTTRALNSYMNQSVWGGQMDRIINNAKKGKCGCAQ
jgi:hypothetical protein